MSRAGRLHAENRLQVWGGVFWRCCSKCHHWKPQTLEHYSPNKLRPCGFQSICKPCRSQNQSDYLTRKLNNFEGG